MTEGRGPKQNHRPNATSSSSFTHLIAVLSLNGTHMVNCLARDCDLHHLDLMGCLMPLSCLPRDPTVEAGRRLQAPHSKEVTEVEQGVRHAMRTERSVLAPPTWVLQSWKNSETTTEVDSEQKRSSSKKASSRGCTRRRAQRRGRCRWVCGR